MTIAVIATSNINVFNFIICLNEYFNSVKFMHSKDEKKMGKLRFIKSNVSTVY